MAIAGNVVARRLLGAFVLSLALHALLVSAFKPVSAHYTGDPFFRAQLKSSSAAPALVPPGRGPAAVAPAAATGSREASSTPRPMVEDRKLAKSYLGRGLPRAGNLPDGRE